MSRRSLLLVALLFSLAGCDQLGLESASVTAARVEADGKAVGAACRHGGRAIEDCFTLNRRVDKAAIYAGWRDMDDYMRENKIEAVTPSLGPDAKARSAQADESTEPASQVTPEKSARNDKAAATRGDKAEKLARADKADKTADDKAADDKAAPAH